MRRERPERSLLSRGLLVRRTRLILLMCVAGASTFSILDLLAWRDQLLPTLLFKLFGITSAIVAFVLIARPWAFRRAWSLSILIVSMGYVLTGADRILCHGGEYETTTLLFVGAALTTGAILPWGVIAQLITVCVAASILAVAVLLHDGNLTALNRDPTTAVAIAFLLSLAAANEVMRYRAQLRRELLERRRAQVALARLAARLEQRVAERTRELEQAHTALNQHQAELAHALRLHTVGEMAAALAHEINQPLCAITNYAQGGVQRLRAGPVDPAALRTAFEEIAREGLRAGDIIRGLRNLVQRETAVSNAVDVNALAADATRLLEPQARIHGVTVRLEPATTLPAVRADGTQIEQVMLNLMMNGMQAAAGRADGRREVVVTTTVRRDTIEVAVADTGRGFDPDVGERIFTPFFTTKTQGLGLGLAISRSIIEVHGGHLWATSRPGAGATFLFSLPLGEGSASSDGGGTALSA
jgi:C4-dicarboxylate-specific signal transduction histidine kinase